MKSLLWPSQHWGVVCVRKNACGGDSAHAVLEKSTTLVPSSRPVAPTPSHPSLATPRVLRLRLPQPSARIMPTKCLSQGPEGQKKYHFSFLSMYFGDAM